MKGPIEVKKEEVYVTWDQKTRISRFLLYGRYLYESVRSDE